MADDVLDHHRAGERERLALMSRLLDPMHRRHLEGLGVQPGMPVSIAEPPDIRAFWDGWLRWSRTQAIDYMIGRRLPGHLAALGLEQIEATAETALYNGGSPWAQYWQDTVTELRDRLVGSGALDERSIDTFLSCCADPAWWTQTIAFTAVQARAAE